MSELKEELRASRAEQGGKRRHEINQAAPSRFRVAGFRKERFTLGNCRVATPAVASHSNFKHLLNIQRPEKYLVRTPGRPQY